MRRASVALCAAMALGAGWVGTAHAFPVQLPRPGQIGIAAQGGYGGFLPHGHYGDAFGSGGSYAFRLLFRMRDARALGISFEQQNFEAVQDTFEYNTNVEFSASKKLKMITTGADFYQFSDPTERTQRYIGAGLGIYQSTVKLADGETYIPLNPSGFYANLTAGLEHFVWNTWALELSVRYLAVFAQGGVNSDLQASAGVVFYAGY
jgi:hypothetical protein